jgi:hypothetical protein
MQAALSHAPASGRTLRPALGLVAVLVTLLAAGAPAHALNLTTFAGITGPLTTALTTIAGLTPSIQAIVAVVGFVVAFISLSALRSFGPVLFFVGLAIFGSVGLVVAGAILGAVI